MLPNPRYFFYRCVCSVNPVFPIAFLDGDHRFDLLQDRRIGQGDFTSNYLSVFASPLVNPVTGIG